MYGPRGSLLIWARPLTSGGGIFVLALDAEGTVHGQPQRIVQTDAGGEVLELVAAATANALGLAWIESNTEQTRTRALLYPLGGTLAAEPTRLATTAPLRAGPRGRLAIVATDGGRVRVMFASGPARCAEAAQTNCTGFSFRELGEGARTPAGNWLSVPEPCPEGAASLGALPGNSYYAVCTMGEHGASTEGYSVSFDPQYARADTVLEGCTPISMITTDRDSVMLGADCAGERRAARFSREVKPALDLSLLGLALTCHGSQPSIEASDLALALTTPTDRLEALLPPAIATAGARALYTGSAVLVATAEHGSIVLHRYRCAHDALVARKLPELARLSD